VSYWPNQYNIYLSSLYIRMMTMVVMMTKMCYGCVEAR